jgi:hypothetical protein
MAFTTTFAQLLHVRPHDDVDGAAVAHGHFLGYQADETEHQGGVARGAEAVAAAGVGGGTRSGPLTTTFTPGRGAPSSAAVTLPVTVRSCARSPARELLTSNRQSSRSFLMMIWLVGKIVVLTNITKKIPPNNYSKKLLAKRS